ncbi:MULTISPECIES: hypothetical protein [Listeria]|uniref:Uncharacterized protein n=3 Tax=Listeria TaxID=1637 RepID=A0ABR6SYB7_9LIST|nr:MULTISPECIES: hypothetical protein [Listeria]EFR96628.1 conserved hypothetical protein [Listeria ivanovii FSL F6-596]AIS60131.1 hypothetical protein JL58_09170 [Listeria ivanovii subsp. londoniensis]AIS62957.1 hypothetical protein JL53_09635 [Listeria ivanovii subsp. londoniensis]MBC1483369.1 hypothetical protein [Listeria immobilis]MBC1507650.1 hypothetical protein [Listeria immobilis]
MSNIASSTSSATSAVAGVKSVTINKGQQVSLEQSTITSMKTGMEVNNQLLTDLAQLIDCVTTQSEKFPKIAELIALQDSQITF